MGRVVKITKLRQPSFRERDYTPSNHVPSFRERDNSNGCNHDKDSSVLTSHPFVKETIRKQKTFHNMSYIPSASCDGFCLSIVKITRLRQPSFRERDYTPSNHVPSFRERDNSNGCNHDRDSSVLTSHPFVKETICKQTTFHNMSLFFFPWQRETAFASLFLMLAFKTESKSDSLCTV